MQRSLRPSSYGIYLGSNLHGRQVFRGPVGEEMRGADNCSTGRIGMGGWHRRAGEEDKELFYELSLGFFCGPAFPFEYKGPLFPVVSRPPWVLELVSDESLARYGDLWSGSWSCSSRAAAPGPAARDQRPRRGREGLLHWGRVLPCPRHARCCRCATAPAPLPLFVIAVPSSPSEAKGEEGTSKWGGAVGGAGRSAGA